MTWTYARSAALLGALLWTLPTAARADDNAARELLQRMIDAVPRVPFSAKVKLSSTTRGWVRDLQLSFKRVGDADATYMEVTAPLDVTLARNAARAKTEPEPYVRFRHSLSSDLEFDGASVHRVDTDRPLEAVVREVEEVLRQGLSLELRDDTAADVPISGGGG